MLSKLDNVDPYSPMPSSQARPHVVSCSLQMSRFKFLSECKLCYVLLSNTWDFQSCRE